ARPAVPRPPQKQARYSVCTSLASWVPVTLHNRRLLTSGAARWAHLLRWLVARSLRRRRPTPQSRARRRLASGPISPLRWRAAYASVASSSPPRIWTHLAAPLEAECEPDGRDSVVDAERDFAGPLGVDVGGEEAV